MTKRNFGIILHPVASEGDLEDVLSDYWKALGDANSGTVTRHRLETVTTILERSFGCLAAGLAFIHAKRVRHKDIKPRNILVHEGTVLYTDFGYSLDSNGISHSTTEGKPDFFTRRYCAPEVLEHEKRNSKSDIYSLGCVFIDIFSAITQAIEYDEDSLFSHIMTDIHTAIDSSGVSERHLFLGGLIKAMTSTNRMQRPCAQKLVRGFYSKSSFMCKECLMDANIQNTNSAKSYNQDSRSVSTFTPWIWSPTYERHYCQSLSATGHILSTVWSKPDQTIPGDSKDGLTATSQPMPLGWQPSDPSQVIQTKPQDAQGQNRVRDLQQQQSLIAEAEFPTLSPTTSSGGAQLPRERDVQTYLRTEVDPNTFETLDHGLRRVASVHHKHFFKCGRVFKMLWTESAGRINPGKTSSSTRFNKTWLGEQAFSEIRYFIVVRNKGTFSQCIPIRTYRSQILTKLRLISQDHCVVYTSTEPPDMLPGENLTKKAIRVDAVQGESLPVSSRVNFGKSYAVEHNVKVLEVGMVEENCRSLILQYWDAAMRGG